MTKLKVINRVGEVWSARSPPPAADALPSSPTLPGKQSLAENLSLRVTNSEFGSCTGEIPIRTFTPEPELWLEFAELCVKKRVARRSAAALSIQPVNLIYKSDVLALLRSITMRILWVFILHCLGLSGKWEP